MIDTSNIIREITERLLSDPIMDPWADDPDVRKYVERQVANSFITLMVDRVREALYLKNILSVKTQPVDFIHEEL